MSERTLILVANAKAGTISTLALAGDKLTTLATSPAGGPGLPLAVDADRGLVYAGVKGSPDHLVTLRLDADSGELTIEHRTPVPDALTYLWLTAENRLLLGASYAGGAGRVWRLDEGRPTEVGSGIFHANLHCVRSSADARFAYFVSLGEDLVAQFSFSSHGELTPLDPPTAPAPSGSGSRHLILDADETNAYVMTEFSGEALHYRRDPATGVLTAAETRAGHPGDRGLKHSVIGADPVPST